MMKKLFAVLSLVVFLASHSAKAANLEETIMISAAGSVMCKIYAEEVGAAEQPFIDMSTHVIQVAENLGYANNFQSFIRDVHEIKAVLKDQLTRTHKSKLDIYNDWCTRFYNGYLNGIARAYN
jgi:hypothetical protein